MTRKARPVAGENAADRAGRVHAGSTRAATVSPAAAPPRPLLSPEAVERVAAVLAPRVRDMRAEQAS